MVAAGQIAPPSPEPQGRGSSSVRRLHTICYLDPTTSRMCVFVSVCVWQVLMSCLCVNFTQGVRAVSPARARKFPAAPAPTLRGSVDSGASAPALPSPSASPSPLAAAPSAPPPAQATPSPTAADRDRADRERADRDRADRERADREREDRERAEQKERLEREAAAYVPLRLVTDAHLCDNVCVRVRSLMSAGPRGRRSVGARRRRRRRRARMRSGGGKFRRR